MKYILILTFLLANISCFSQPNKNSTQIDLNKGLKISIVTTLDGAKELGQEKKMNLTLTTLLTVVDADKADYVIDTKLFEMAKTGDLRALKVYEERKDYQILLDKEEKKSRK